jgi:hypothetical protein
MVCAVTWPGSIKPRLAINTSGRNRSLQQPTRGCTTGLIFICQARSPTVKADELSEVIDEISGANLREGCLISAGGRNNQVCANPERPTDSGAPSLNSAFKVSGDRNLFHYFPMRFWAPKIAKLIYRRWDGFQRSPRVFIWGQRSRFWMSKEPIHDQGRKLCG